MAEDRESPERKPLRLVGSALHLYELLWGLQQASQRQQIPFAYPTIAWLQQRLSRAGAGLSRSQICRIISDLRDAGLIRVVRSSDAEVRARTAELQDQGMLPKGRATTVYFVKIDPRRLDERPLSLPPRKRRRGPVARADQPNLFDHPELRSVRLDEGAPVRLDEGAPVRLDEGAPVRLDEPSALMGVIKERNKGEDESAPGWLVREWLFYRVGPTNRTDDARKLDEMFAALLGAGYSEETIRAEILRPDRDRAEHIWDFNRRIRKNDPSGAALLGGIRSWLKQRQGSDDDRS